MNIHSLKQLWRDLPRSVRIALLAVMDIALIGGGLCIFALFHHVIPRQEEAIGAVSSRNSAANQTSVQQTIAPDAGDAAIQSTIEPQASVQPTIEPQASVQPAAEPTVSSDPVGYFGTKFADKFTDGEVINKLLDDGTGIYQSANLNLTGTTHHGYNSDYYVVDIYVKDIACLKTAMANDKYGRGQRQWPSEIAEANNAIAAINGDFYSARQEGTVLRNGVLYRDYLFGDVGVLYWDGTFETYNEMEYNLGIGGGVQTGYQYALENGYDIAIQFDGDGQHMAEYLHDLMAPIERGEANITIGSRFIKKEGFQSSALRRFGIVFLSGLIKMLCGVRVHDVTSGMRAADRKMIALYAENYAQDYPEPEAIVAANLAGAVIEEIPVQMRERQSGKSSIHSLKSIYYMIKVSIALAAYRITHRRVKS